MNLQYSFINSYAGALYRATSADAQLYSDPTVTGSGTVYSVDYGDTVRLTGFAYSAYGVTWLQVESGGNLWLRTDDYWTYCGSPSPVSRAAAQDIVDKLMRNNQIILENNLLLARFSSRLSTEQRRQLYTLQTRLSRRDTLLRDADVFQEMGEGKVYGYSVWENHLISFMRNPGIGVVISTTTAIIIAAVVAAAAATAAYYAFKAAYAESVQDVKLSNAMLETFAKYNMTDEDIALIQRETQGIVTKAVLMQKIRSSLGSVGRILLFVGGGVALYFLMKKFKEE